MLWFTLLCSETRKRSSSSSWLLAAAGSRDEAQSGGSGGRDVVDPGAHTDLRASSLIAFHRDGFCEENKKRSKRLKKMLRRLFKFSQGIVFNGSLTGRRLLDDRNCWKFSSTARFPRARNWQDFKSPARCCLLQHFCPTSNPKSNIMSTLLIWSNRLWTINVQQKSDFFFTLQVFRKNLNEEKTSCSVSTLQWNAAQ